MKSVGAMDAATRKAAILPLNESLGAAAALDPINRISCLELSNYLRNTLLRDTTARRTISKFGCNSWIPQWWNS
jgi:hypothetical protein